MTAEAPELGGEIAKAREIIERIFMSVGRSVIGQEQLKRRLVTGLITEGHILLEGVPGLAKTLAIKSLAAATNATFKRVQFTPDLLPSDLIGTEVFKPQSGTFEVRQGPVFANFVLADEINRAPAKVQSALLETMQERQVTIGNQTYPLPDPFFVMATQNPIEQEGTYPLPEAQVDRFMMKVRVDYPARDEEKLMLDLVTSDSPILAENVAVTSLDDIKFIKRTLQKIYVDERVRGYILDLVSATRQPNTFGLKIAELIEIGASPRATISLFLAARAEALFHGEHFVVPQNIKDVALDVLRHRITPTYEAEARGLSADDLLRTILDGVKVP